MSASYGSAIEVRVPDERVPGGWTRATHRGDLMQKGEFVAYDQHHGCYFLRYRDEGKKWRVVSS